LILLVTRKDDHPRAVEISTQSLEQGKQVSLRHAFTIFPMLRVAVSACH